MLFVWQLSHQIRGFQTPLDYIPQGTVLRMSLANWWKKGDSDEERCYLQLSGWYL